MDINDLFDGIMKSINQFAEGCCCTSCAPGISLRTGLAVLVRPASTK